MTLRLRGLYLALATLAFGLLVDSCAVGFLDITGGPSGLVGIPSFSVGRLHVREPARDVLSRAGARSDHSDRPVGAMRSGFGRALKAIRSDQMAAAALGINTVRYKLAAFLISVTLASLAGSLLRVLFQFPGAGNGRHLALARTGGDADHRRREHAGRWPVWCAALDAVAGDLCAARDLQDLCVRRAVGLKFPLFAAGNLWRADPDHDAAGATRARCRSEANAVKTEVRAS